MTKLTPTERLEWLRVQPYLGDAKATIEKLLEQYDRFLDTTNLKEEDLIQKFLDKNTRHQYFEAAHEFGDSMFRALTTIGKDSAFHRLLVV
ncbi:hypothetical protein CK489_15125 [Bradyrhizobium sp. UFLA03-84]|uniref:hypothetical protein n=1 Tax=Bradyrhizobium sp. UFLA03-84 TaxID=418599 RepID=UPI000BAE2739|nr:hypothetical protein [Bradyrhizobium sp. UFLA03-84]PAY07136.1 hypothetical protein CK489_15125 [Bradyrhizobium sp. UFLA03-84]